MEYIYIYRERAPPLLTSKQALTFLTGSPTLCLIEQIKVKVSYCTEDFMLSLSCKPLFIKATAKWVNVR